MALGRNPVPPINPRKPLKSWEIFPKSFWTTTRSLVIHLKPHLFLLECLAGTPSRCSRSPENFQGTWWQSRALSTLWPAEVSLSHDLRLAQNKNPIGFSTAFGRPFVLLPNRGFLGYPSVQKVFLTHSQPPNGHGLFDHFVCFHRQVFYLALDETVFPSETKKKTFRTFLPFSRPMAASSSHSLIQWSDKQMTWKKQSKSEEGKVCQVALWVAELKRGEFTGGDLREEKEAEWVKQISTSPTNVKNKRILLEMCWYQSDNQYVLSTLSLNIFRFLQGHSFALWKVRNTAALLPIGPSMRCQEDPELALKGGFHLSGLLMRCSEVKKRVKSAACHRLSHKSWDD